MGWSGRERRAVGRCDALQESQSPLPATRERRPSTGVAERDPQTRRPRGGDPTFPTSTRPASPRMHRDGPQSSDAASLKPGPCCLHPRGPGARPTSLIKLNVTLCMSRVTKKTWEGTTPQVPPLNHPKSHWEAPMAAPARCRWTSRCRDCAFPLQPTVRAFLHTVPCSWRSRSLLPPPQKVIII